MQASEKQWKYSDNQVCYITATVLLSFQQTPINTYQQCAITCHAENSMTAETVTHPMNKSGKGSVPVRPMMGTNNSRMAWNRLMMIVDGTSMPAKCNSNSTRRLAAVNINHTANICCHLSTIFHDQTSRLNFTFCMTTKWTWQIMSAFTLTSQVSAKTGNKCSHKSDQHLWRWIRCCCRTLSHVCLDQGWADFCHYINRHLWVTFIGSSVSTKFETHLLVIVDFATEYCQIIWPLTFRLQFSYISVTFLINFRLSEALILVLGGDTGHSDRQMQRDRQT